MKNADMPAMPIVGGDDNEPVNMESSWYEYHGKYLAFGLTKREMMAMHMFAGLLARDGKPAIQYEAELAIKAADALLAELERTE